jgi:hypothetical protein
VKELNKTYPGSKIGNRNNKEITKRDKPEFRKPKGNKTEQQNKTKQKSKPQGSGGTRL